MTGANAGFASSACIEIDSESVLLAFLWAIERDEIAVIALLRGQRVTLVLLRETLDGGESLLRIEQLVDQRARLEVAVDHTSLLKNS